MAVSYKRLFKLMIDKDLKKKDLVSKTGIAYSTIRKLENGVLSESKIKYIK